MYAVIREPTSNVAMYNTMNTATLRITSSETMRAPILGAK